MRILFASSEVTPFAKTGGLADVSRDLPLSLARRGEDVAVVMPAYRSVFQAGPDVHETGIHFELPLGSRMVGGSLLQTTMPGSEDQGTRLPVYLIKQDRYFDRPALYQDAGVDFKDNCERFVFFCKAVMELPRLLEMEFDIVHANDWQTGLLPAYLATDFAGVPGWENTASVFTIHNLAYQGIFWHWDMLLTGMDWKYFNWQQMEFFGNLNLMKTGLTFADALTTVSPRYAQEIQSAPVGCGLESVLRHRAKDLVGILNGVNYEEWNPATDELLPATYTPADLTGKALCKTALLKEFQLPERNLPLIGLVGRLSEQKGIDAAVNAARTWAASGAAQFVFLGTGDVHYQDMLQQLAAEFPNLVSVRLAFSNQLAHLLEAGSDIFLMPSRYEPCGLNQMYSLKYGTVPVVHETGGLADTVTNVSLETLAAGTANGFSFSPFGTQALNDALRRALGTFKQADTWRQVMLTGMTQDWSWDASAHAYATLYRRVLAAKRQNVGSAM